VPRLPGIEQALKFRSVFGERAVQIIEVAEIALDHVPVQAQRGFKHRFRYAVAEREVAEVVEQNIIRVYFILDRVLQILIRNLPYPQPYPPLYALLRDIT